MEYRFDGKFVEDSLKEQMELCSATAQEYEIRIQYFLERQLDRALTYVPFYRETVNRNLWTHSTPGIEKLKSFQTLSRRDIQRYFTELKADDIELSNLIVRTSSGSSGSPVSVLKQRCLFEFYAGVLIHKMICHGWTPFDTYFLMHGAGIGNIPPGISVKDLGKLIFFGRPDILFCYPSYLLKLIDAFSDEEISSLKMKFIGTHSETSSNQERAYISRHFSCPVYDDYGATEVGPIASQCEFGRYHIVENNVFVEIIDEDGNPASPDSMGEIVVTDLRNRAMPLIRYRTGDFGRWGNEQTCSCRWRNMRQLAIIDGRMEDSFRLPSGRILPPGQLIGPLSFPGGDVVRNWQFIQETLSGFKLKVVKGAAFRKNCVNSFVKDFERIVGEPVEVTVEYVEDLPNEWGKRRVYISHLSD